MVTYGHQAPLSEMSFLFVFLYFPWLYLKWISGCIYSLETEQTSLLLFSPESDGGSFFLGFYQVFTVSFLYCLKNLYFEIIVDYATVRNITEGSCMCFHPVSPKGNIFHNYSTKQYHNQEIDINNLLILFGCHPVLYVLILVLYVYFILYDFIL